MQWISAVYSPGCRQSQSQSHRDGPPVGPGPAPQPPSDRPRSSPYPPARTDRTLCVVESDWRWQSPGLYKTEYNIHYYLTTCHCDRLEKYIYPYLYHMSISQQIHIHIILMNILFNFIPPPQKKTTFELMHDVHSKQFPHVQHLRGAALMFT